MVHGFCFPVGEISLKNLGKLSQKHDKQETLCLQNPVLVVISAHTGWLSPKGKYEVPEVLAFSMALTAFIHRQA